MQVPLVASGDVATIVPLLALIHFSDNFECLVYLFHLAIRLNLNILGLIAHHQFNRPVQLALANLHMFLTGTRWDLCVRFVHFLLNYHLT